MESRLIYPVGEQDFPKIRKSGMVYVDKTDLIFQLASKGSHYSLNSSLIIHH